MTEPSHIRHHGIMIDASFRKDGTVEYWTVGSGVGKFYYLEDAKQVAEHRARRKSGD